jgi:hypothetical protein
LPGASHQGLYILPVDPGFNRWSVILQKGVYPLVVRFNPHSEPVNGGVGFSEVARGILVLVAFLQAGGVSKSRQLWTD